MAPQQAPVMTPSLPFTTAQMATLVMARITKATSATRTKKRLPEAYGQKAGPGHPLIG